MDAKEPEQSVWLAIYSMWLREVVAFWRQKSRLGAAIGTPLLFWLVLGGGFDRVFKPAAELSSTGYFEYFFPGVVILTVLFSAIYSTISVIEDRRQGFLQGVLVAPVSRSGVVVGKMLGAATMALFQGLLMMLIAPALGLTFGLRAVVAGAVMLFVVAFGLAGLGLTIAWTMDSTAGFHAIMNLILMPMWLISGAVFPVPHAHWLLRLAMQINPLTYGVSGFRHAIYLSTPSGSPEPLSLWVCTIVTVGFAGVTMGASIMLANRKGESGR